MVERRTADGFDLANGISIEIHTASFSAVRGYTLVGAVLDEVAFWQTGDDAAQPDAEIVAALRPGMATVPGAMLIAISSPYARRGALWAAYEKHYGRAGDVLVWSAPTRAMNATVPESVVETALAEDESHGRAEWLAEFRRDVESYVSREAVQAVVVPGRVSLPPAPRVYRHRAFTDPSGGSGGDSMVLAISHAEQGRAVIDLIVEQRPPFSPDAVCESFAQILKNYGCHDVVGDAYAGAWPGERFAVHGISYKRSERTKAAIYTEFLPVLTGQRVELPDSARLKAQLLGLERRTARGGRDVVDHAPRSHDDLINATAGAALLALDQRRGIRVVPLDW
jgi:hypothetical protein